MARSRASLGLAATVCNLLVKDSIPSPGTSLKSRRAALERFSQAALSANAAWARVGGPPPNDRYFVLRANGRRCCRGVAVSEKNDRDLHKNWPSYVAKILVSRIQRDLVRWLQTVPDYRRWQYLGDLACLRAR